MHRKLVFLVFVIMLVAIFSGCSPTHRYPYIIDVRSINPQENKGLQPKQPQRGNPTNVDTCNPKLRKCKLIVFVHGVLGNGETTWGDLKIKDGKSWPMLIKNDSPDFNAFDIYSFSYETNLVSYSSNITEISNQLQQSLENQKVFQHYSQIHFVTHSMGGLVAKRMLINLHQAGENEKLDQVRTVFFIGTPAHGSFWANVVNIFSLNPQFNNMRSEDINAYIQTVAGDWATLRRARKISRPYWPFPAIYCAHETKSTYGLNIVDRTHREHNCDKNSLSLDADHLQIVKPRWTTEEPYPWVKRLILEASEKKGITNNRIVLMDSSFEHNVYDHASKAEGRTNADDIDDIFKKYKLPIRVTKELTNNSWSRYVDIREMAPALIIIHYSAFEKQTTCSDRTRRFRTFMKEMKRSNIKFLIYSRALSKEKSHAGFADCKDDLSDVIGDIKTAYGNQRVKFINIDKPRTEINNRDETFKDTVTAHNLVCEVRNLLQLQVKTDCKVTSQ